MATLVTGVGSPLEEYFRDAGDDGPSIISSGEDLDQPTNGLQGDGNSVPLDKRFPLAEVEESSAPTDEQQGWTGFIHADPGPSKSRLPVPRLPEGQGSASELRSADAGEESGDFAERFKYLICSSGIMEKDYVPGLGDAEKDITITDFEITQNSLPGKNGQAATQIPQRYDTLYRLQKGFEGLSEWSSIAKERWDVSLAFAVLLLGFGWLVHLQTVLTTSLTITMALGGLWATWVLLVSHANESQPKHENPQQRHEVNSLQAVNSLLASSKQLDSVLEAILKDLHPLGFGSDTARDLRLAFHRTTENLTDHLAAAVSKLLTLVDKKESRILGELYDISMTPSRHRNLEPLCSSEGHDDYFLEDVLADTNQYPSEPYGLSVHRPAVWNRKRASYPLNLSRTLPTSHMTHLSLRSSPMTSLPHSSFQWTPRDRFTSLPPRTPRSSKRLSLDPEMWSSMSRTRSRRSDGSRVSSEDDASMDSASAPLRRSSGPARHDNLMLQPPARFTTDESSNADLSPPHSHLTSPATRSNGERVYTPFKRSPLASNGQSPNFTHSPRFLSLSAHYISPRKSKQHEIPSDSLKRRSLQSIPYHSSDDSPTQRHLRKQDMLPEDLQAIRSRGATGARPRSRAASASDVQSPYATMAKLQPFSANTTDGVVPSPKRPTHQRAVSDNPLTLPSLKASCLGVHLKRRKIGCMLLALRFSESLREYWEEVRCIILDLVQAFEAESTTLSRAGDEARQNGSLLVRQVGDADPLRGRTNYLDGPVDFAPRQSDRDILRSRIKGIQSAMTSMWNNLESVSAKVDATEDLQDKWKCIREVIRSMTREWEKGKDAVSRLSTNPTQAITEAARGVTPEQDSTSDTGEDSLGLTAGARHSTENDLPEFLIGWSEDSGSSADQPQSTATTDLEAENAVDDGVLGKLPLPGIDEVFEDFTTSVEREKSQLSRSERISLVKEARAKGISLEVYLNHQRHDGYNGLKEIPESAKQMRDKGSAIVDELRGMITLIRQRKGLEQQLSERPDQVGSDTVHHGDSATASPLQEGGFEAKAIPVLAPPIDNHIPWSDLDHNLDQSGLTVETTSHDTSNEAISNKKSTDGVSISDTAGAVTISPPSANNLFTSDESKRAFIFPQRNTSPVE